MTTETGGSWTQLLSSRTFSEAVKRQDDKVLEEMHQVLPKVLGNVSETKKYAITLTFKRKAMVFSSHS